MSIKPGLETFFFGNWFPGAFFLIEFGFEYLKKVVPGVVSYGFFNEEHEWDNF